MSCHHSTKALEPISTGAQVRRLAGYSLPWLPSLRCRLKAAEVKSGRDGAAHKRPFAEALRRLPCLCRHDRLRASARA